MRGMRMKQWMGSWGAFVAAAAGAQEDDFEFVEGIEWGGGRDGDWRVSATGTTGSGCGSGQE